MIIERKVYKCTKCNSEHIVKNSHSENGKQKFHCKDCGTWGVLNPSGRYSEEEREQIIRAYYERSSMRGIERIFGVSRHTLSSWLKKKKTICHH